MGVRNRFNESNDFLKQLSRLEAQKKRNTWSEMGIPHYRAVIVDVLITLPQNCSYTDPNGHTFSGTKFVGEIQFLMDSYLYAKRETSKYWKVRRIRKSQDLLDLPIWEHPDAELERKATRVEETKKREQRAEL